MRSLVHVWHAPQCESVGLPWLRFIDAQGVRRASAVDDVAVTTEALAIGAHPNVLWAITSDGSIRQSTDAGCTWTVRATVPDVLAETFEPQLVARHPERVYAYTGGAIVRLTAGTVESFPSPEAGDAIVRLEADPTDVQHVRAITRSGGAWESFDGVATWQPLADVTSLNEVTVAAFDPRDFDHIVAGTNGGGLRVSRDGGRSWTPGPLAHLLINDVIFSPADERVLWVDAWPGGAGVPSRLYASNDAGATFVQVGENGRSVAYFERLFAPHPFDVSTFATHADNGSGVRISGPAGTRTWIYENVKLAVWSPSGTLYFVQQVIETR